MGSTAGWVPYGLAPDAVALLLHVAATWAMVGLIWFVQIVHYPLFSSVGRSEFVAYEGRHTTSTSWVVGLFMPIEAVTGVLLVLSPPGGVDPGLTWLGLALLGVLWSATALWQAPLHGKLSSGFDVALHRRLVRSNWLRTVLWTGRGMLVLVMVDQAMAGS